MKIRILADYMFGDLPLFPGQMVIVSDEDGAQIIADGVGESLPEDERGGFAVPMPSEE
jgi:hypothetical protein